MNAVTNPFPTNTMLSSSNRAAAAGCHAHPRPHCMLLHIHAACFRRQPQHNTRLVLTSAAPAPSAPSSASSAAAAEVDVVVVGAGIIGLLVARQLLLSSQLTVGLFDAKQPTAGATGAGEREGESQHLCVVLTAQHS